MIKSFTKDIKAALSAKGYDKETIDRMEDYSKRFNTQKDIVLFNLFHGLGKSTLSAVSIEKGDFFAMSNYNALTEKGDNIQGIKKAMNDEGMNECTDINYLIGKARWLGLKLDEDGNIEERIEPPVDIIDVIDDNGNRIQYNLKKKVEKFHNGDLPLFKYDVKYYGFSTAFKLWYARNPIFEMYGKHLDRELMKNSINILTFDMIPIANKKIGISSGSTLWLDEFDPTATREINTDEGYPSEDGFMREFLNSAGIKYSDWDPNRSLKDQLSLPKDFPLKITWILNMIDQFNDAIETSIENGEKYVLGGFSSSYDEEKTFVVNRLERDDLPNCSPYIVLMNKYEKKNTNGNMKLINYVTKKLTENNRKDDMKLLTAILEYGRDVSRYHELTQFCDIRLMAEKKENLGITHYEDIFLTMNDVVHTYEWKAGKRVVMNTTLDVEKTKSLTNRDTEVIGKFNSIKNTSNEDMMTDFYHVSMRGKDSFRKDKNRHEWAAKIIKWYEDQTGRDIGVVCPTKMKGQYEDRNIFTMGFVEARGTNEFRECDRLFVVGCNRLSNEDYWKNTWKRYGTIQDMPDMSKNILTKDGSMIGIEGHEDYQKIWIELIEKEIYEKLFRIRFYWEQADQKVYLMDLNPDPTNEKATSGKIGFCEHLGDTMDMMEEMYEDDLNKSRGDLLRDIDNGNLSFLTKRASKEDYIRKDNVKWIDLIEDEINSRGKIDVSELVGLVGLKRDSVTKKIRENERFEHVKLMQMGDGEENYFETDEHKEMRFRREKDPFAESGKPNHETLPYPFKDENKPNSVKQDIPREDPFKGDNIPEEVKRDQQKQTPQNIPDEDPFAGDNRPDSATANEMPEEDPFMEDNKLGGENEENSGNIIKEIQQKQKNSGPPVPAEEDPFS